MRITVRYFAQARELAGASSEELALSPPATVRTLHELVLKAHPRLNEISSLIRFLANGRVVTPDERLEDGDRVACFPPVGGG